MTSIPQTDSRHGTWYVRLLLLEGKEVHFALAALFLFFDYLTGPSIQAAITYIIPVAGAAWFSRRAYACILAVAQPLVRITFPYLWKIPHVDLAGLGISFGIRVTVLLAIAWLIGKASSRQRALESEVETLENLLPVCRICKRIRDTRGDWRSAREIRSVEQIPVSRGRDICPECSR